VGAVLSAEDGDVLVAAAFLHDVGYAPSLNRLGFHPGDGARFLRGHGQDRLAYLVAITSERASRPRSAAWSTSWPPSADGRLTGW
jgi:HD superfamily phosphodiesterase